jgi:hypothetical protein
LTTSVEKWAGKSDLVSARSKREARITSDKRNSKTSVAVLTPPSSSSGRSEGDFPKPVPVQHGPGPARGIVATSAVQVLQPHHSFSLASSTVSLDSQPLDHREILDNTSRRESDQISVSAPAAGPTLRAPGSRATIQAQRLQQLVDKRMSVLGVRVRLHESRNALRNRRETRVDRNARFYQELRNLAARSSNPGLNALLSQYEDIESFGDEMQLKESEYNILEDELNRKEWEMKEDETRLYQQIERLDHTLLSEENGSLEGDAVDVASASSTVSTTVTIPPLRKQWLSRMGDRDLLIEQLQELRAERAYFVEDERFRQKVGQGLSEEARSFLATFDSRHKSLQEDLTQVEADVSRLQEYLSHQADVLYSSSQFDGETEDMTELRLDSRPETVGSEYVEPATKDPLFLPNDEAYPVFSDVAIDPKEESMSAVSYINQWLLHRLRRSAIEVRRYKSSEKLRMLQLDRERLAQLVVEWWSKDETVSLFPRARDHAARSISVTSRAIEQQYTNKATLSDSVVFDYDRIARRLQSSQSLRPAGPINSTFSWQPNVLQRPYYPTRTLSL